MDARSEGRLLDEGGERSQGGARHFEEGVIAEKRRKNQTKSHEKNVSFVS